MEEELETFDETYFSNKKVLENTLSDIAMQIDEYKDRLDEEIDLKQINGVKSYTRSIIGLIECYDYIKDKLEEENVENGINKMILNMNK